MINKKGDVWVSAVLYIALGMVVITLILSAGLPLIEKMRDKNTIVQTKNMLFNLNANIESVANEGPGSRRYISPFIISSGSLIIEDNDNLNLIIWKMTTKNLMMKPNKMSAVANCAAKVNSEKCPDLEIFKEGALNTWMVETAVEGEYDIYLELKYKGYIDIVRNPQDPQTLAGEYSLSIEHVGFSGNEPKIQIKVT